MYVFVDKSIRKVSLLVTKKETQETQKPNKLPHIQNKTINYILYTSRLNIIIPLYTLIIVCVSLYILAYFKIININTNLIIISHIYKYCSDSIHFWFCNYPFAIYLLIDLLIILAKTLTLSITFTLSTIKLNQVLLLKD